MVLNTFTPKDRLRAWLRDELNAWAKVHSANMRIKDIKQAVPEGIEGQIKNSRYRATLLRRALTACYDADQEADSVEHLGELYANMARIMFDIIEYGESGRKVA